MNLDASQWWTSETQELLDALGSSPAGLSTEEATLRLRDKAVNQPATRDRTLIRLLVSQFNSPIILLLAASAVLSYFLDDKTNAVIIFVILILSGLLGFYQEYSAANAVKRLLALIQSTARVLRDGREEVIAVDVVVPGDIVLLQTGTIVPGDCRLIEAHELFANEAALTGESFPVEKNTRAIAASTPLRLRCNCLFLGTHIVSGTGKALVVHVGRETQFGAISEGLQESAPATSFEQSLRRFGKLLVAVTACLVLVVFLASLYFRRPVLESFLFALALAVGMTPQLLPAITSVVLARGAKSMAAANVIVKRLLAIENFGSMDTLCMDKTGTLTTGQVQLDRAVDLHGKISDRVLQLAAVNAHLQSGFDNPIDSAIRCAVPNPPEGFVKLGELPYDFQRRRLSVLARQPDAALERTLLVSKGAPNSILEICTRFDGANGSDAAGLRSDLQRNLQVWGEEGFRVLGVAYRELRRVMVTREEEADMTFAGFLLLLDPLRDDAASSLAKLQELGVQLKIITGDSVAVAKSIAMRSGIANPNVVSGDTLQIQSQSELSQTVLAADVFAEVVPDQKQKIVFALSTSNHVIGFLGDGINDAPALHVADVGISVSSAVDVAKEAAQVVMLKPGLEVLSRGVIEGRKTLSNTLKYIYVAISANFGYMLSMAIASLFLPFLPLLPSQILLINLLADFPAMALATDSVDAELIARPRHWDLPSLVRFMFLFGLTGTLFDLVTFAVLIQFFHASQETFRTGWFLVSIMTGLGIMLSVRTRRPIFLSRPGSWLIAAMLGVMLVVWSLPFSPLASTFELVRPTAPMVVMVGIISTLYVLTLELGKWLYFRSIG